MKKDSFIKKNKTVLISIVLIAGIGVCLVYGYGLISGNTFGGMEKDGNFSTRDYRQGQRVT